MSRFLQRSWWPVLGMACAFAGSFIGYKANAETVAITGGKVIVGDGSAPIDGGTVVIRDGTVEIGRAHV